MLCPTYSDITNVSEDMPLAGEFLDMVPRGDGESFGVNIIFGMGSIAIGADGASVAWQAHIGGFLAGLMLFSLFDPVPRTAIHAADASSPDEQDQT